MLPTISLGPVVLPTAGIIYILGIWLALSVVEKAARRLELDAEKIYTLAAVSTAAGFIGARLAFVLLHWPAYKNNLIGIIWPLNSGFELWAGLLTAVLAGLFYSRAKQLEVASTMDALAPGLISILMVVSLADFLGGPGYGTETSVPWGLDLFGIRRHPVQIYEFIVGLAALAAWVFYQNKRLFDGQLFLICAVIYSGGRLFLDAFRANSWLTEGGYHIMQIISLTALLTALYIMGRLFRRIEKNPTEAAGSDNR